MPKTFFLSWVILVSVPQLTAQIKKDTVRENIDYRLSHVFKSVKATPESYYTQYLGMQANQLLKLINYKANNKNLSNPYGFTYAINHTKTGYGIGLGFGYESSKSKDFGSGAPIEVTTIGKTWYRIGLDKRKIFFKRWTMGAGVDLLFSREKTIITSHQNGFINETINNTMSYGLGPRATIQYQLRKKFRLGTEVCWYFKKLNTKTSEKFTGLPAEYSKSNSTASTFLLPISIFMSIRVW